MRIFRIPALVRRLVPQGQWRMPVGAGEKTLYLTFDDGPIPDETPFVLEQLAGVGARGTFFCVGDNVARHPEVAQQVLAAGHRLGNHTHHHLNSWKTPPADYLADIARCQQTLDALEPTAAETRPLLRPPYGRITHPLARTLAVTHQLIMWDVLTYDFDATFAPEQCLRAAVRYSRPGAIVVFHDSLKASRNLRFVLPRYLQHFAEQGYQFRSL
ncbi:polysaccharide deacetylase family protein [Hymenobacter aerilatus]|uniref:Polysaccharide deacetylase family protein n=1 Tax=Hymenobacter aerilatus TaxID=2932251 RepID=A0A8T9T2J0_9BACT|nr:polysaccharide deacetylase family protein [Hymenobacter aerilatus]UOR06209.1 polysaccharide deacetylase family protein [Hymenobacter aerilatus]